MNDDKTFLHYRDNLGKDIIEEITTKVGELRRGKNIRYSQLDSNDEYDRYFCKADSIFDDQCGMCGVLPASEIVKNVRNLRILVE